MHYLPRLLNVQLSTLVTVGLPALTGVITLDGGQLLVDTQVVATPASVDELSLVAVRLTSSAVESDTTYVTVFVDGIAAFVVSATTQNSILRTNYPQYENVGPFEITKYDDGYPFFKTNQGAASTDGITEIDLLTGLVTDRISDLVEADAALDKLKDYAIYGTTLWWVDHHRDELRRLSLPDKTLLPSIQLPAGNSPYGLGFTSSYVFYVSCTGTGRVLAFDDSTFSSVQLSIPSLSPKGVYVDANDFVYVAESGSNTVLRINSRTKSYTRIVVGQRPMEIAGDSTGVYVTCFDDTVYKISLNGVVLTHVSTGKDPVGIVCANNRVYVACSFSNEVRVYNQSLVQVAVVPTSNEPQYLAVNTLEIAVGCHGVSAIEHYDATSFALTKTTPVPAFVFGLTFYGDKIYAFSGNSGIPNRTFIRDSSVAPFSLLPFYSTPPEAVCTSPEVTIEGFDPSFHLPCSIPAASGATLFKNGVAVVGSTSVSVGDKIKVTFTAAANYNTSVSVPVTVGDYSTNFTILTLPYKDVVNPVWFSPVQASGVGVEYQSNEVVVDGLTPGISVACSLDSGTLLKNGVAVAGNATTVVNGDKLRLVQTSVQGSIFSTFTISGLIAEWLIFYDRAKTDLVSFTNPPRLEGAPLTTVERSTAVPIYTTLVYDDRYSPPAVIGSKSVDVYPFPGTALYVDGVLTEATQEFPASVKNGQTLQLDCLSSSVKYDTRFAYAVVDGQLFNMAVRTLPDDSPNPILLQDAYGTIPRVEQASTVFQIEGISGPDADIQISVERGVLYINGVLSGASSTVRLHDLVQWVVAPEGPYSGVLTYKMTVGVDSVATWTLHNLSLNGVVLNHDEYLGGTTDAPILVNAARAVVRSLDSSPIRVLPAAANLSAMPTGRAHQAQLCNFIEGRKALRVHAGAMNKAAPPQAALSTRRSALRFASSFAVHKPSETTTFLRTFDRPGSVKALEFVRAFKYVACNTPSEFVREFAKFATAHSTFTTEYRTFDSTPQAVRLFEVEFSQAACDNYWPFAREFARLPGESVKAAVIEFQKMQPHVGLWSSLATMSSQPSVRSFEHTAYKSEIGNGYAKLVDRQGIVGTSSIKRASQTFSKARPVVHATAAAISSVFPTVAKTVLPKAFTSAKLSQAVFVCGPMLTTSRFQKTTDYPEYDGKFSTIALAQAQARLNGYTDAVVFLDADDRYIYRATCALRAAYNTAGWIRGG